MDMLHSFDYAMAVNDVSHLEIPKFMVANGGTKRRSNLRLCFCYI